MGASAWTDDGDVFTPEEQAELVAAQLEGRLTYYPSDNAYTYRWRATDPEGYCYWCVSLRAVLRVLRGEPYIRIMQDGVR